MFFFFRYWAFNVLRYYLSERVCVCVCFLIDFDGVFVAVLFSPHPICSLVWNKKFNRCQSNCGTLLCLLLCFICDVIYISVDSLTSMGHAIIGWMICWFWKLSFFSLPFFFFFWKAFPLKCISFEWSFCLFFFSPLCYLVFLLYFCHIKEFVEWKNRNGKRFFPIIAVNKILCDIIAHGIFGFDIF